MQGKNHIKISSFLALGILCVAELSGAQSLLALYDGLETLASSALVIPKSSVTTPIAEEKVHVEPYVYSPENIKGIERIIKSSVIIDGKTYPYTKLIDIEPEELLQKYSAEPAEPIGYLHRFIAKTSQGKVVGFAWTHDYKPEEEESADLELKGWLIGKLAVDVDSRGLGIGKAIFDYIAQWVQDFAKKYGKTAEFLYIECDHFNKPACAAYRKWTNNNCKDVVEDDPEENYTLCKQDLQKPFHTASLGTK